MTHALAAIVMAGGLGTRMRSATPKHLHRLLELGAFRADVSGAGPAVYGLFSDPARAARAAVQLDGTGRVWVTQPAW